MKTPTLLIPDKFELPVTIETRRPFTILQIIGGCLILGGIIATVFLLVLNDRSLGELALLILFFGISLVFFIRKKRARITFDGRTVAYQTYSGNSLLEEKIYSVSEYTFVLNHAFYRGTEYCLPTLVCIEPECNLFILTHHMVAPEFTPKGVAFFQEMAKKMNIRFVIA
jgi:hypothetical protein